jgi:hypothetical protein
VRINAHFPASELQLNQNTSLQIRGKRPGPPNLAYINNHDIEFHNQCLRQIQPLCSLTTNATDIPINATARRTN